jgi:hypothetical protein
MYGKPGRVRQCERAAEAATPAVWSPTAEQQARIPRYGARCELMAYPPPEIELKGWIYFLLGGAKRRTHRGQASIGSN